MKNLIKILTIAVSLFFAVLFSYTAMSKATNFKNFHEQLAKSPGLEEYGEPVAYSIIALQTVNVILLCYRPLRFFGLLIAFGMLTVFTAYNGFILIDSKTLPCTCIGLFEKMTWKGNLVLNIGLMITALTGIMTMKAGK